MGRIDIGFLLNPGGMNISPPVSLTIRSILGSCFFKNKGGNRDAAIGGRVWPGCTLYRQALPTGTTL